MLRREHHSVAFVAPLVHLDVRQTGIALALDVALQPRTAEVQLNSIQISLKLWFWRLSSAVLSALPL